jgi:GNAT superfamily N-acetyltransferase
VEVICLHDKKVIEPFLRKNIYHHIYSIGDLDNFFWQNTLWYALKERGKIHAIAELYTVPPFPMLLAFSEQKEVMQKLLQSILYILPARFYAHLSSGLNEVFEKHFRVQSKGKYYKMGLNNKSLFYEVDCSQVIRLDNKELPQIQSLYKESYPNNWFDPRMLETKQYFGIRVKNQLVSIGGVHVYSEQYKVAALGNIATHPDYRGNGFGKCVTAKLCQSLSENVDHIGLNVKDDNEIAIDMYKKLGFEVIKTYGEYMIEVT